MKRTEQTDRFDEFFDDIMPPITIGQLEYAASNVLKEVDPVAYRQEFLAWLDDEDEEENDGMSYSREPELNPDR